MERKGSIYQGCIETWKENWKSEERVPFCGSDLIIGESKQLLAISDGCVVFLCYKGCPCIWLNNALCKQTVNVHVQCCTDISSEY